MNKIDLRQIIQDSSIQEVEMGDVTDDEVDSKDNDGGEASSSKTSTHTPAVDLPKSKWETDATAKKLDKLDGIKKRSTASNKRSMDDFLSVTEDYTARTSAPGKKRVRWADIQEREKQQRLRDVGFVVGHTNWSRMMDDSHAEKALNRTKIFHK